MSELMNNVCLVRCKSCGTVLSAEWDKGVLGLNKGWKLKDSKGTCPVCHNSVNTQNIETVICPHCKQLVEKTEDGLCVSCHKSLYVSSFREQVECPKCGMSVPVPEDPQEPCTCAICGEQLSVAYIRSRLAQKKVDTEQYIRLPDAAWMKEHDAAIWKHPQSIFPFKSRLQVNEGTFALFLQNGVCRNQRDPGDYLLEDSDLERSQKLDAAMQDETVIFQTDIFCVLRDLDEFGWGSVTEFSSAADLNTDPFRSQEQTSSYTAGANGRVALQICDAKAFARFAGFQTVSLSGLTSVDPRPDGQDGLVLRLVRDRMTEALYASVNGLPEEKLDNLSASEIKDRVTLELNQRLASDGLCVRSLWINSLTVKKTGKSLATDRIRTLVQNEFRWSIPDTRVNAVSGTDRFATVGFSGSCRVKVVNESGFWGLSEMKKFLTASSVDENEVISLISGRVTGLLKSILPMTAQNRVDRGEITDLLNPGQYVSALSDTVRAQLSSELAVYGLALQSFRIDLPEAIRPSAGLSAQIDLPARRTAAVHAAETGLHLLTAPVRIHTKGDPSVYTDVVFGGNCYLRVVDEGAFFRLSEVNAFLSGEQAASEQSVTAHFTNRLKPLFEEVLSCIAQSVVEQTNADIRELNRFTGLLKDNVQNNLAQRIAPWGLALEAVDLDVPKTVSTSPNLELQASLEQTESGTKLQQAIEKLQNDHTIFRLEENGRVSVRSMELQDATAAKEQEMKLNSLERENALKTAQLRKGADLDALIDEIAEAKHARAGEAILEEYRRKYRLREEEINQKIREERLLQEARIDAQARDQHAAFEQQLAQAENKKALNDIMHRIDESDLTWRQKLDEYDRLRRRTLFMDEDERKRQESDTELKILRDKNELYFVAGSQKLKLDAEQAELIEKINRYNEERSARVAKAEAELVERKSRLDFEQRLQDRREQVAQQIDQLTVRYEHELAMRSKEIDLEKLKQELEAAKAQAAYTADVQKTQAQADSAAKIAQAQAQVSQMEKQLAREETIAARAEEFQKALLEIQKAIELTKLDNEKNRDDRLAAVAVAQAHAGAEKDGARIGKLEQDTTQRYLDLEKKMDRIINSVQNLRTQVNNMKRWLTGYPYTPGVYPPSYTAGTPGFAPVPPVWSAPAAPAAGTAAPGIVTPVGAQPGVKPFRSCPLCYQTIPADAKTCPYCKANLG